MIQALYACKVDKETKHYIINWFFLINGNVYSNGTIFTDLSRIDENVESIVQEMHHTCEHISFANKHGSFVFIDQYLKRSSNRYVQRVPGDIDNLDKYVIREYPGFKLFNHSEELKSHLKLALMPKMPTRSKDQPPLFYCSLPRDRFGSILTIGWHAVWNNNLYTRSFDLNLSVPFADLINQLRVILKELPNCVASVFANTIYAEAGNYNADLRANIPIDESIIYANSISELLTNMLKHEGTPSAIIGAVLSLQNSMRFCTVEVIA